jgi:putative transposase
LHQPQLTTQANGKLERWNKSVKSECIRPGVPLSLEDAEHLVAQYVTVYNEQRLHSALGYVTPLARLQGRQTEIQAARDRKLEQARQQREQTARSRRNSATSPSCEKVA